MMNPRTWKLFDMLLTVAVLSVLLQVQAAAAPYFKLAPLRTTQVGAFVPIRSGATMDDAQLGAIAPVIVHEAADGFLLLPGVSWDLLDLGYIGGARPQVAIGPSIHLDEPVKKGLRFLCRYLPGWKEEAENYGLLKSVLAAGSSRATLAIGPMGVVDLNSLARAAMKLRAKEISGSVQLGITLNQPFGGGK